MTTTQELPALIEQIACEWDGCMYDAPGGAIDIGDSIRRAAKQTARAALAAQVEPSREQRLERALADMEARKDGAYEERNKVVAALAKLFPSGIARTAIEGWSEDWHGCVYIDLPTGQVSWHFHDSQAHLFAGLPPYTKPWDGHDTPEKYRRLAAFCAHPLAQQVEPIARAAVPAVQPPEFREVSWGVNSTMRPCKGMAVSEYAFRQWAEANGIALAAPQVEARQEPKPDSSYPAQPSGEAATARDAGAMWDRFIAHLNECDSIEHVNLLGGVAKYRQAFIDAALSSTPAQGDAAGVALPAPSAEQLLDGAEFVQHRGGGQFRTCAEWDASGVFVPLGKWHALVKRLAGVPASDNWQQYAKAGETALACIERHRREQDGLMKLLAHARGEPLPDHEIIALLPAGWTGMLAQVMEFARRIERTRGVTVGRHQVQDRKGTDDV